MVRLLSEIPFSALLFLACSYVLGCSFVAAQQLTAIENVGTPVDASHGATFRYLVGNRDDGTVRLDVASQPGNGDLWKVEQDPNGHVKIENMGTPVDASHGATFRYLVGNRDDGTVRLHISPQPGRGDLWAGPSTPQVYNCVGTAKSIITGDSSTCVNQRTNSESECHKLCEECNVALVQKLEKCTVTRSGT